MSVTFVSALYKLQHDSLVGGRSYPLAWYFPSLRSISQMKVPLVLYVWPEDVSEITEFCSRYFDTFKVIGRDLADFPLYDQIQEIRIEKEYHLAPNRDRCHTLCLNKFYWLREQALSDPFKTETFFWIDAGLAHEGLFPEKHLPRTNDRSGSCNLFNTKLPFALAGSVHNFLFLGQRLGGELIWMHDVEVTAMKKGFFKRDNILDVQIVGGLFGGKPKNISAIYNQYEVILKAFLDRKLLGTEENILTMLYFQNRSFFNLHLFDTWYHEDTPEVVFQPDRLPFYRIFEELNASVVLELDYN